MKHESSHTPDSASLLQVLTFFVTYRCNSRCKTCFYWKNLNNPDEPELSLEEIRRIAASIPRFSHLLLSGGEPLLRPDLHEIIDTFINTNHIVTLDLPTNGLMPEKTADLARWMLIQHPDLLLTIGVSIDGFKETHDTIRGVDGNFEKVFETLRAVNEVRYALAAEHDDEEPRLHLYTLTCLTDENSSEVPSLIEHISENADIDGMMFELMRGSPRDSSMNRPSVQTFDKIVELSLRNNYELFSKRCSQNERSLRLAYLEEVYAFQRKVLLEGALPVLCRAGRELAVLEPNGDVRLCELLDPVGNLRDYSYDFPSLWNAVQARQQREWIKKTNCSCTHCVNIGHSIDSNMLSRLRRTVHTWQWNRYHG